MNAYIIKKPVITEKSLMLASTQNTYTFEVERGAHKGEIKVAIEKMFNVKVESVNTVFGHRSSKKTGRKRLSSSVAKTKKAIVKLKKGDTIALFDIYTNTEAGQS
jgi:large subunit ribosomal protein L23